MKLQIALDDLTMEEAIVLMDKVQDFVDIIEIGTPFIYEYGMEAVRTMKKRYPDKEILADMKIMDAGYYEAEEALKAGADYVTVLAVTDLLTIQGCVKAAQVYGKEIVVDMICVTDLEKRIKELEELGVHGLAVHKVMSACAQKAKISVAGGIKAETVPEYAAYAPEVLIVGSGICHAEDPAAAAKEIYQLCKEYS